MQGGAIPFVAGCLFLAFGLLAMQGVVGTLWRSRRFRGRADGKLVALEAVDGRRYSKASDVRTGPNAPLSFRQVVDFSADGKTYQARGPFLMREVTKVFAHAGGQGTSRPPSPRSHSNPVPRYPSPTTFPTRATRRYAERGRPFT